MDDVTIPDGLEPVAVWDTGYRWCDDDVNEKIAWARQHIDRVNDTWKVEFYATEPPHAIVHRFKRNDNGRKHVDPLTGNIACDPPVIVPLGELPPAHLLR